MITVVGLGALGSHVALLLRNRKEGLKLIDFDRVDSHNTQAQFHGRNTIRQIKSESLSRNLYGTFGVKTESVPHKLTVDNVHQLLSGSDVVIDSTDNYEARTTIKAYCANCTGVPIPCIHGALSADGSFARVVWSKDFSPDEEGSEGEATCENGDQLPFFAMVAACLASEVQRFLNTKKRQSFQLTPFGITRLA